MKGPLEALAFALEKYPERVEISPLSELLMDSGRDNDRRPAFVKLAVPDDVVKGLRGSGEPRELLLMVRIPRDILERSESRIVLPGEV